MQELTEQLHSSESTIRRDLNTLDAQGRLIKIHGGAMAVGGEYRTQDAAFSLREDQNRAEKLRIAQYAASLIRAHDFVYLDAGTSTALMIDFITAQQVTFVTDAPTPNGWFSGDSPPTCSAASSSSPPRRWSVWIR